MSVFNIQHEEFTCQRDGLRINGTMFKPKGAGPFPFVIVSHEFMMNRITTVHLAYTYAKMGFAAFCYDFNGGGAISQSEGKTTKMSVKTEVQDLLAVIDYAKSLAFTDNDQMILHGCSQGGFASALAAAELGADEVKRLILFYPALSIPDDMRKGEIIIGRFDPDNVPERIFCGPITVGRNYPEDVMDWDAMEMISKYHGPVLIVHGTADHVVDYKYAEMAYDAYRKGNEEALTRGEISELPQVELETIKNGEHIFPVPMHRKDAVNTAKEFIMGRTEVMRVDVALKTMTFKLKGALLDWDLPFGGDATGKFFNGTVRDGAHDQRYYGIGTNDVTADYHIDGKDCAGETAEVHVINKGVPGGWKPTVTTTSKALDFMNHTEAFARLRQRGLKGPLVRIFMDFDATK